MAVPACDRRRARDRHEAGSSRIGAALRARSLRSSRRLGAAMRLRAADAFLSVHLTTACPSGLTVMSTPPSHSAVRPPGRGCGRPRWAIGACASKRCRQLLFCNQQLKEHPRVAAISDLLAQSLLPSNPHLFVPPRFAGRCFFVVGRRPLRRGFGAPVSDDGAVGQRRRPSSGGSRFRNVVPAGNHRVDLVGARAGCCADRIFCGPCRTSSPRTLLLITRVSLWECCG
jgi:hypothetical protein